MNVPEIDEQLQTIYEDKPAGPVICGCGDDRTCTHASSRVIEQEFGPPAEGAIMRYFGGQLGGARIVLVTLAAQYGEKGLADFMGRDFIDIAADFGQRAKDRANVIFAVHSSTGSEANEAGLNAGSTEPVGCAYASLLGGVSAGTFSEAVRHNSLVECPGIFGTDINLEIERVCSANRLFVTNILSGRHNYSVGRQDYARAKAPVMLLDGSHADNRRTLAVDNFRPDKISNPTAAHNIGRPFYNNDITQVAEVIIKSYPEYKFDPLTLLLAMDIDVRSTRAALAGGDPAALQLQRYGDARVALDYLSNL